MNVDLVTRGGKRPVNNFNDFSHKLGQHETMIPYIGVVYRDVGLDEGQGICCIGKIKVENVGDSKLHEFGNVLRS